MQLQEKQLSDFSPVHSEFCRFSSGSKLLALLNVRHPSQEATEITSLTNDGTKISIIFESCNIMSCFFYFDDKICGNSSNSFVQFHSFLLFLSKRGTFFLLHKKSDKIIHRISP